MVNLPDVPFTGRFYARLEALTLASLGDRLPAGHGDALLIYDSAVPYLYLPNSTATGWLKFALIDVTSGEPTNGHVLTWNTTTHKAGFAAAAGGGADALLELTDVDADPAPTDEQVLTWRASDSKALFKTPTAPPLTYSKVQKTGMVTVTNGNTHVPTWDVETHDTIGGFNLGADATIFTAPSTGVYQVIVTINGYAATPEARINVNIRVNGSNAYYFYGLAPLDLPITTIHGSRIIALSATNTISIAINPLGTNFDTTVGECYLEVIRLS